MPGKTKKETGKKEPSTEVGPVTSPSRFPAPFKEFERMFESLVPRRWPWRGEWEWPSWPELPMPFEGKFPKVDVIERDDAVVVRAEVPGVEKKDLDVSVTDNAVTVKGETSHEAKKEDENYYRCEISRGSFSRTVGLPADVEGKKAKASFKDGVLELVIPKQRKSSRHRVKVD